MTKFEEIVANIKLKGEFSKKIKQVSNIEPNDLKLGEYIIINKEKIIFSLNGVCISDYTVGYSMFKYSYIINDLNLKKPIKKSLITEYEDLEKLKDIITDSELENLVFN